MEVKASEKSVGLPKLTTMRTYLTQKSNLNVPVTGQESTTVFLFASSPHGIPDNMIPYPDLDPILPSYQPFPGDEQQMNEGRTTYNLMNDSRVRRGLYTMNKTLLRNSKGKPTGWKRVLPKKMTIPPIPPKHLEVSTVEVANELSCSLTPTKIFRPENLRRSRYSLRHGVTPGLKETKQPRRMRVDRVAASTCYAEDRPGCLSSLFQSKNKVDPSESKYKRSPAALVPTWRTELAAASGRANVGIQARATEYTKAKTYTVFSQTDENIALITGIGSIDKNTNAAPGYYKPVLLNYYRKLTLNYNKEQEVQVIPYEIFDFKKAARPIVKRLTKAVVEQAAHEVLQEEELDNLKRLQRKYELQQVQEHNRLERLKSREQKLMQERDDDIKNGQRNTQLNEETENRIGATSFAISHLNHLMTNAIQATRDSGFMDFEGKFQELNDAFLPWIQSGIHRRVVCDWASRALLDDIIQRTVMEREVDEAITLFKGLNDEFDSYTSGSEGTSDIYRPFMKEYQGEGEGEIDLDHEEEMRDSLDQQPELESFEMEEDFEDLDV